MVERILRISFDELEISRFVGSRKAFTVLDPTCGTGNFLLLAALFISDKLLPEFPSKEDALDWVVVNCIYGLDIDALAIEEAIKNLSALTENRVGSDQIRPHFHVGNVMFISEHADLFSEQGDTWETIFPEIFSGTEWGFDAIFGNPPFLNPLKKETAIDEFTANQVKENLGDTSQALTNTATLILQISRTLVKRASGFVAIVQPISIVATRDSADARREIDEGEYLSAVWICEDKVFDAAVQTCVLFISTKPQPEVRIYSGAQGTYGTTVPKSRELGNWSKYVYSARGLPDLNFKSTGVLGELAHSSNDFRDEYYGLVGAIISKEDADDLQSPKLITVGKIDLVNLSWGYEPTKFAKEAYEFPRVEVSRLEPKMLSWATRMAMPKILVATQTKIVELFVDDAGILLPSIPIASVFPKEGIDIWKVAASLASPVITLYSLSQLAGAGMNAEVLKISARFIITIPLPSKKEEWAQGARLLELAQSASGENKRELLTEFGKVMGAAYEVDEPEKILDWWSARL
jgi:hypothetical protein